MAQSKAENETKNKTIEEVLAEQGVEVKNGLSGNEAGERLKKYGLNELSEKKANPLSKFFSYFWGPIPWMIEAAVILSAIVKNWTDFTIIMLLLITNAVVGFWEEYHAGNAIEALKKKLAVKAKVRRDRKWKEIPANELAPGDIIRIRLGDIIPADIKLLHGDAIEVDQSSLTGESLPAEKKTGEDVYSGSIVNKGEIEGVVFATGANTYFGKTAQMIEEGKAISHFQKAVLKIGDYLIIVAIAMVAVIITNSIFRHEHFLQTLRFSLVLTVAAIPVAMPTVLSVTMAVGARLLAAKEAIVRRLASIEELAGIDVLCSDKTGTLTQNKLVLGKPAAMTKADEDEIILAGSLASREEDKDAIDIAVINGMKNRKELELYKIEHFLPFDPVHKRSEATVKSSDGRIFKVSKGAPQVIFELADNKAEVREQLEKTISYFASKGNRSLGVARTDEKNKWQYLGIIPLYDPPRDDCRQTIEAAKKMGVNVKMVTGDQAAIGKEVARQIGLGTNFLDAMIFGGTKHHETGQLAEKIEKADGFAQVFPEHKYHIVDVLQQKGHIVGMTGDGVNDAPALKKADAGIAVSGASDAARSAADIVLMTPGISVIVEALKESRKIFRRMDSYAVYRISETIRVLLFMTVSILVFRFYPVTAIMIVLLALLNDGAILSIAYDKAKISDKPETWNMRRVLGVATSLGVAGVIASFGLFYLGEQVFKLDRELIQTLIYLKLSVAGHMTIFLTRTRGHFWADRPSNILLVAVIGTQLIATLFSVYGLFMAPIGWKWALIVWVYAIAWFFINDWIEIAAYRIFDGKEPGFLAKR